MLHSLSSLTPSDCCRTALKRSIMSVYGKMNCVELCPATVQPFSGVVLVKHCLFSKPDSLETVGLCPQTFPWPDFMVLPLLLQGLPSEVEQKSQLGLLSSQIQCLSLVRHYHRI